MLSLNLDRLANGQLLERVVVFQRDFVGRVQIDVQELADQRRSRELIAATTERGK